MPPVWRRRFSRPGKTSSARSRSCRARTASSTCTWTASSCSRSRCSGAIRIPKTSRPCSARSSTPSAPPPLAEGVDRAAAILRPLADVAQLVERLLAMQKVDGSSPFIRLVAPKSRRARRQEGRPTRSGHTWWEARPSSPTSPPDTRERLEVLRDGGRHDDPELRADREHE